MSRSAEIPKWGTPALRTCFAVTLAGMVASGCTAKPAPELTVPPTASELIVVGEDTALVRAAVAGHRLFVTVPGSTGCDWLPKVTDISISERRVDVELTRTGSDPRGANLLLRTHEVEVELDVHGYDVHVQFDG